MTELEYKLLEGIAHSEYQYTDPEDEGIIGAAVWSWSATGWAGLSDKRAGGVMSSLVKKGWVKTQRGWEGSGNWKDDSCWITEAGYRALQEERSRRAQHEEA